MPPPDPPDPAQSRGSFDRRDHYYGPWTPPGWEPSPPNDPAKNSSKPDDFRKRWEEAGKAADDAAEEFDRREREILAELAAKEARKREEERERTRGFKGT